MLQLKRTRIFLTEHKAVMSGHVIAEEGAALVYFAENDGMKVRMSTGAAGEVFAGFSLSRNAPAGYLPHVEEFVIGADPVELPFVPASGMIFVSIDGTAAAANGGAPAAGEYNLNGAVISFNAADVGKKVFIQFMFEPTVNQARALTGDAPIGGLASIAQEVVGTITRAEEVATSFYDASADWSGVINPKLGANGMLTPGGSGTLLTNVVVINAPSAGNPFLVVRVNV